jgi:hypothetical protein
MSKDFGDKAKSDKWEPSTREIEDLRTELKEFPQKLIGSKLVCPFDQYLISLGTIKLEDGQIVVRDPEGHQRLAAINAKLEWKEWFEHERTMKQFPEEKQIFLEKVFKLKEKLSVPKGLIKAV